MSLSAVYWIPGAPTSVIREARLVVPSQHVWDVVQALLPRVDDHHRSVNVTVVHSSLSHKQKGNPVCEDLGMGRATKGQVEAVFCFMREDGRELEGGVLQAGQTATPVCTFSHSFRRNCEGFSRRAPRLPHPLGLPCTCQTCSSARFRGACQWLLCKRGVRVHGSCAEGSRACWHGGD
jgi:hypothetical protein